MYICMSEENVVATSIESTTTPTSTTVTESTVTETAPVPKYKKRIIEMVGLESCGGCQETVDFIEKELKPNSDVPIEFTKHDVNSEKGKEIVKDKNLKYVPWVKECLIPSNENETPQCKEINAYDRKFFQKPKINE